MTETPGVGKKKTKTTTLISVKTELGLKHFNFMACV